MTEEGDVTSEQEVELFSFQHKLIHEYVAAHYVARQIALNPDFLYLTLKSHEMHDHIEVLGFCSDIVKNDSQILKSLIDQVSRVYSDAIVTNITDTKLNCGGLFGARFREVIDAMLSAFVGKGEAEFVKFSKAFIHMGAHSQHYCIYAAREVTPAVYERILIMSMASLNDFKAALSFYSGLTHIYLNDVGIELETHAQPQPIFVHERGKIIVLSAEREHTKPLPIPNQGANTDFQNLGKRHRVQMISLDNTRPHQVSTNILLDMMRFVTGCEHLQKVAVTKLPSSIGKSYIEVLVAAVEAQKCPQLKEVDLPVEDLKQLPIQSICHVFPYLKVLDVSGTDISNSLHLLTEHVESSLVKLNISRCNLTRADIEALAEAIEAGRFPKLQDVNVMGNDLSQSLHLVHLLPGFTEMLNSHSIKQYLPQSLSLVHLLDVSEKDISNPWHLLVQTSLVKLNISRESDNLTRADIKALPIGLEAEIFPKLQEIHFEGIKRLDISGNNISNSLHLFTEHAQTSLVKLNISQCNLTKADIEALAIGIEAGRFPKLQDVDVKGNDLGDSLHLLTEHVQTSLVKLDVCHCNLTRADIEALAEAIEAGRFPKLQDVNVMGNDLSQSLHLVHLLPGFTEMLNSHSIKQYLPQSLSLVHLLPGLEELEVRAGCQSNISNSLHLLTEHAHTSLVKLNVSHCNLSRVDIEALAAAIKAGRFPKLQEVDFTGNDLSNSLHLLTKHVQTSLVKLNISRCNLTRADIEALAEAIQAGRFPKLHNVNVMGNDLSQSLHLLTEHVQTSLIKLKVRQCNLTRANIESLVAAFEAGRFPKLQHVDVMGNDLSQSLHLVHLLPGLKTLDLDHEDISNSLHLLTQHVQANLLDLNMAFTNITRSDISALAAALTAGRFPKLERLDLMNNDLDDESVQPLCEALLQYQYEDSYHHLTVWLVRNRLSAKFRNEWSKQLRYVSVELRTD